MRGNLVGGNGIGRDGMRRNGVGGDLVRVALGLDVTRRLREAINIDAVTLDESPLTVGRIWCRVIARRRRRRVHRLCRTPVSRDGVPRRNDRSSVRGSGGVDQPQSGSLHHRPVVRGRTGENYVENGKKGEKQEKRKKEEKMIKQISQGEIETCCLI